MTTIGPSPDSLPGVPPLVVPLLLCCFSLLHVCHLLGHRPHLLWEGCRGSEVNYEHLELLRHGLSPPEVAGLVKIQALIPRPLDQGPLTALLLPH